MAKTGMNTIEDLLATRFPASQIGLDTVNEVFQRDLAQSNEQAAELESMLCDVTTDRQRIYGTSGAIEAVRVDEFGRVPSRKKNTGVQVDFPMYKFENALGFTNDYLKRASARELAAKYLQARDGHFRTIVSEIKKAIFNDANYAVTDDLVDNVTLNVKRFLNADGSAIPEWEGATFDGATHTHYMARESTLANSDIDALISNVTEHGNTLGLMLVIHLSDKAAISALTGFTALSSVHVIDRAGVATDIQETGSEDVGNRMIGYWNSTIPVFVKPYGVDGYVLCVATGMPEKPLCFRNDNVEPGIKIAATIDSYPLMAEVMSHNFGVGVWNRTAGAVLYIDDTTWANPTL
jgi:hypothetical protein